jgi:hypothetical protein
MAGAWLVPRRRPLTQASLLQPPADEPVVPERVDDTTLPHSVRLIRHREHLRRAGRDGLGIRRVRVVHVERDTNRCRTDRLRARRSEFRGFGRDAKMLTGDLEDPDLATVRRDQTFTFLNGAECPNVEVHRTGNVSHSQEGIQLRHRFDASNADLESQGTKSTIWRDR